MKNELESLEYRIEDISQRLEALENWVGDSEDWLQRLDHGLGILESLVYMRAGMEDDWR